MISAAFTLPTMAVHHVGRYVVRLEEGLGVSEREALQVAHVADGRLLVRMREEGRGEHPLDQAADGPALGPLCGAPP